VNSPVRFTLIGLAVVAVGIQVVPVDRSNPPTHDTPPFPAEVVSILKTACYDCHSNETSWPWYAYVAPVSWLVTHDVNEGRAEMNVSGWSALPERRQLHLIHECGEEVEEGHMPPSVYLPLHPEAKLSDADRATLLEWAETEGEH